MSDRRLNEHEGGPDERHDDLIRDALAPLKEIGMPAGARASAERRIHASLAGDVACRDSIRTPWWRRRVSVPFPVAAGIVLFLVLLGTLQLWQLGHGSTLSQREVAFQPGPVTALASQPQYYEETLYVPGMGVINGERGYRFF